DALESLADKSLVVMHTGHRFGLLESVRAYAVEKLAGADAFPGSGEPARAAAEGRHGLHYAEFGTGEASEAMERRGGPALWQLLRSEAANLTVACERALVRGADSVAVGTCIGLWSIRTRMGPFSDMATLAETVSALPGLTDAERVDIGLVTERALQRAGRGQPRLEVLRGLLAIARRIDDSRLTWRALLAAGRAVGRAGDWDKARLWIREALAIARGAGNRVHEAVALNLLAGTYMEHNDLIEAESLLLASAELYRQIGNRSAAFTVMRNLGTLYHNLGRLDESRACLERALEAARELGERASEGVALSQLGYAALAAGRLDEARRRMDAAMPVLERVADRRRLAQALSTRGCVLVEIGQLDAAHADFERALSIERERANRFGEAATLVSAAPLARLRALPEARHRLDQALAIARGLGRRFLESQALYELGCLQLQLGDFEASGHTLAEAATTASEIGAGRTVALAQARQASALLALGKVDDARKHAMLALGTLGAAGGDQDRALAHLILGQVEASACDLEAAASLLSSVEASLADRQPTVEAKAELARLRSALARGPTVPDDGQGGRPVELQ
ncbi:MAG: tetratricopeptide (TPR) repeat protein, partial [Myxococcota bacterium]